MTFLEVFCPAFPTTIWVIHTMTAAVYGPAVSGAIAHVDFRIDANTQVNTRVQSAMTQGTRVYVSVTANWTTGATGQPACRKQPGPGGSDVPLHLSWLSCRRK